MAESLDPGVERRARSPNEGQLVTLLVKLTNMNESSLDQLEDCSDTASVEDILELGYVRLVVAEEELEDVVYRDLIASAEIEKEGGVMGDFRTQAGLTL